MDNAFELLPQELCESITNQAKKSPDKTINLYRRYYPIIRGFEEYDMRNYITQLEYRHLFETALKDFVACIRCDGTTCRTSVGNNKYFGLSKRSMHFYRQYNRPEFAVFECPGVATRKQQIREALIYQTDTSEDPPGGHGS